MDERRQALGMTWAKVASEAEITVETLRAIRRFKNEPSTLTKRGLERALHWKPDSIDEVLAGREPTPLPPSGSLPALEAEVRGMVEDVDDEPDSPIAPYLKDILERVDQRLAEMNKQIAEAHQEIKELRRERRPDEEDRRRKGA
jgi:transcriptional regulator with XRE-family HTH domain